MILALDTSTLTASAALLTDGGVLVAARNANVATHSEHLLPLVDELLRSAALAPSSLTAIACGAGPGSFTGLRIGLATAKGLCFALGKPLLMVSSLAALALRAPPRANVIAAIDAFKGEVYAGFYRRGDGATELIPQEPERVIVPIELAAIIARESEREPLHLVGDVVRAWPVLAVTGRVFSVDVSDQDPPRAADVGRLAAGRLKRGEHDDLAATVPTYIRASEAEIKRGAT